MSNQKSISPITEWFFMTGVLAGAIVLGFFFGMPFFQSAAMGFIGGLSILMAFTFIPGVYIGAVLKMAHNNRPAVPILLVIAADLTLAVVLAKNGHPGMATALTLTLLRSVQMRKDIHKIRRIMADENDSKVL